MDRLLIYLNLYVVTRNDVFVYYESEEGLKEELAEEEGEDEGVGAGEDIVEHYAPAAVDVAVDPTAAQRLEYVDKPEGRETEEGEDGRVPRIGDVGHKQRYPCAHKFINHYGARVFTPITLHDA